MRRFAPPDSPASRRGAPENGRRTALGRRPGPSEGFAGLGAPRGKPAAPWTLHGTLSALPGGVVPLAAVFDSLGATPTMSLAAVVAIVGAAGAGAFAYASRRKQAGGHSVLGPMPLSELDREAARALVTADDAVRTSAEELGYAAAESGNEVTAPFSATLEDAQSDLAAAFRLRLLADEDFAQDEAEQRELLDDVVEHCRKAEKRLDHDGPAFSRLRSLVREAERAWGAAVRGLREQQARVEPVHQIHDRITALYRSSATAAVADDVRLAWERLVFAEDSLAAARVGLEARDNERAASLVRGAEAAVDQARRLLDAVGRRSSDLEAAMRWLPGVLADLETDTAAARRRPALPVSPLIAPTEALLDTLHTELAGRPDPLDCMRRATTASTRLGEFLATTRTPAVTALHIRTACDQIGLVARSEIAAADDLVTTRRAVVGYAARTRLSEARRHLEESEALLAREPTEALEEIRQADLLAREATRLALADVERASAQVRGELASAVGGGIVSVGGDAPGFGGEGTRWRLAGSG